MHRFQAQFSSPPRDSLSCPRIFLQLFSKCLFLTKFVRGHFYCAKPRIMTENPVLHGLQRRFHHRDIAGLSSWDLAASYLKFVPLGQKKACWERIGINCESTANNTLYFSCNFCSPESSKCFTNPAFCSVVIIPKDIRLEENMYF